MEAEILTVTQLTDLIKGTLEETFPGLWVTGEISNYLHHSSGHRYFTLKDPGAQIKCVIWKFVGQHLTFEPENGMKVKLFGDVTVYSRGGVYQIRVTRLLPLGVGELEAKFQELKQKLYEEGLFDEEHKKPLPLFPSTIGIVTSPTGAAIRDMINILTRRAPWVRIILAPVHVQGEGAAEEIARAIGNFNRFKAVDLIIAGRGGGSLEDLWAFNEEVVARAIYASDIPVVSAVGHQIDYTISDFVADLRAPTPSAAAELVAPDIIDLRAALRNMRLKLSRGAMAYIELAREKLSGLTRSPVFRRPMEFIYARQQEIDDFKMALQKSMTAYMKYQRQELSSMTEKLVALSPEGILQRGYAVVRSIPDGKILKRAEETSEGKAVSIKLYKGSLDATVDKVEKESD
ncbi:MAG TPA: exodeoxyribonuclease VII large subunit [candidate division Zixibacteria bacterium]|nr:exodeoxyribonuclease VII large subunit [candidate division Zixibacteria bacterium]